MSESQSLPTLTPSIHAVFLLHGLWGWPEHMHALRDALHNQAEKQDASVDIYCCRSYEGTKTYDGVDVCADRVVAEIRQHIIEIQQSSHNVEKLSILGYSLGGLIARLTVHRLKLESFFDNVQACNFTTFASPAIGIPKIPGVIPDMIQAASAFFLSRTGSHLYLRDKRPGSGRPLVYDLATAEFTAAVAMFRNVDIYANAVGDRVVPYLTGGISVSDPFMPALAEARREPQAVCNGSVLLGKLLLNFDQKHTAIVDNVCEASGSSSLPQKNQVSAPTDISLEQPSDITTPLNPSLLSSIRPWFDPTTYPFIPFPLNYILVILIPLVVPAVILVVSAFSVQRVASAIRVRRHLRRRGKESTTTPPASEKRPVSHDLEAQVDADETHIDLHTRISPASTTTIPTSITVDLSGVYPAPTLSSSLSLPPMQKEMVKMLDKSIHMRKHLAFLPNVFTSHPVIICQDRKNSEHQMGLSVVEHWASHFLF